MDKKKTVGLLGFCLLIVALHAENIRAVEWFLGENSKFSNGYISTKTLIVICLIVTIIFLKTGLLEADFSVLKPPKERIKKELIIAGILVVIIVVGLIVIRLVLQTIKPEVAERPFFGLYFWYHTRWFYPLNSFLQEAFMRIIIQDNMKKLETESTKYSALILTALFFSALHMAYPWYMMLGTVVYCIVTGYIYDKYKCIYGLTAIHFFAGFLPRCFGVI